MYNCGMGTLMIQTQTGIQNPVPLWMMSGNQGNVWSSIKYLTIPLDQNTEVTKPKNALKSVINATSIMFFIELIDLCKLPVKFSPNIHVSYYSWSNNT